MAVNLLAVFDLIRKPEYQEFITEIFKVLVPLYGKIKKVTPENIMGSPGSLKIYTSYEVSAIGRGVGPRLETDEWPIPGELAFEQSWASPKRFLGKASLGMFTAAEVKGPGSLVNAVEKILRRLIESATVSMGRMFMGDGTGKISVVTSVAGDVLTVASGGTVFLRPGDCLWAFYLAGTVPHYHRREQTTDLDHVYAFKILDIDHAANQIIVEDAGDIAADDELYLEDCVSFSNGAITSKEWTGIQKIISNSGVLQNLDRDTHRWWRSYVNTAQSGRDLTTTLLNTIIEEAYWGRGVDSIPEEFVCSPGVFIAWANELISKSVPTQSVPATLGFAKAISYTFMGSEIRFWPDRGTPTGTMYGLIGDTLRCGETVPFRIDTTGSALKVSDTHPRFDIVATAAGETIAEQPWLLLKVDELNEE